MEPTADLICGRQIGLVTRRQCIACGMTERQIESRVAAGLLVPVHRAVYRAASAPRSPDQDLLAACLSAGTGAVASHRSAGVAFGLRGIDSAVPEITVPGSRRPRLQGVVVHRSPLAAADVGRRGVIPVTRPGRTLLDLAAVEPGLVEGALDDALVRGLTTLGSLTRVLEREGGHGRPGSALLRRLVADRDSGQTPTESALEDAIVRLLRRHGLPDPVRQHEVTLPDGGLARLDLAYPNVRVGIEADGRIWHSGRTDFTRDRVRANRLVGLGWTVLRYGWDDLRHGHDLATEVERVSARMAG